MRLIRRLCLLLLAATLAVAGWLWLTLLSPWTYDRPDHLGAVGPGPHRVFVYGTLRHTPLRWLVTGRAIEGAPARLEGFRREGLDIQEAPGEHVAGEVLVVSAAELARLDRYERLGIRYTRVRLSLADGRRVWVYRRLPEEASTSATRSSRTVVAAPASGAVVGHTPALLQ